MPRISVIIPAYNDQYRVLRALDSLRDTSVTGLAHYHVQDDCSTEPFFIPASLASCQRNPANLGFAANCHAGAAHAKGEILFFVNQDIMAVHAHSQGWDNKLLDVFDRNPGAGIVGCKLLFFDPEALADPDKGRIQHAGVVFDKLLQPHHRFIGYKDHRYPPANHEEAVKAVTGAAFAIRRRAWDNLHGFDMHRYPGGYFEDIDLCLRMHFYSTWHVRYAPQVCFIHEGSTAKGNPGFSRNAAAFRARWADEPKLQPDIPVVKETFWQ